MRKGFRAGLLALMLCIGSVRADFDVGLQFYLQGDLATAYREFKRAAEFGHKQAQFNLGSMYARGEYVPRNLALGYAWLALSHSDLEPEDNAPHQRLYDRFDQVTKTQANAYYAQIVQQFGDAQIVGNLRPQLNPRERSMRGIRAARMTAFRYPASMQRRGREGWVDLFYSVDKDGTTRDHTILYSTHKAFEEVVIEAKRASVFEPALVDGEPVVTYGLRCRCFFSIEGGTANEQWLRRFVRGLKTKAEEGDPEDMFHYAFYMESLPSLLPSDTRVELEGATWWFLKAAEQGHALSAYMLGAKMLTHGARNEDMGLNWLMTAAEGGIADAYFILAMEMLAGARLAHDERKALHWLSQAAKSSPAARVRYAWVLSTHPDEQMRQSVLAKQLLDAVDSKYLDRQGYYQTLAAQAAESGDFRAAVRWQKRALADAEKLDIPRAQVQARLAAYESNTPWREAP